MDQVGFTGGHCREPRMPLTEAEQEVLAHAMAVLGVTTVGQPV
jgi:hypothetical protein